MSNPLDQAPQPPPNLFAQMGGAPTTPAAAPMQFDLLEAAKASEMALSRLASISPDLNGLVNEFIRIMRTRLVGGQAGAAPPPYTGANNAAI